MTQSLAVALLPSEALQMRADVFVVIDQLRATTTIATLFGAGLRRLTVVDEVDAARNTARDQRALLFGEVGGLRPEGFDYGNSPTGAASAPAAGRDAVLFTSNGTRALCALGERGVVLTAAIANVSAVVGSLVEYEHIALVCAGNDGGVRFSLEDAAAATALAHRLVRVRPSVRLGDAARMLLAAMPGRDQISSFAGTSRHARVISALGFDADIAFAARPDTSAAVPRVVACGPGSAVLEDAAPQGADLSPVRPSP